MDRGDVIALVKKQAGVKLSADDPILAAVAINDVFLDYALEKLDASLKAVAERQAVIVAQSAEASRQTVEDAKRAAESLVNTSMDWVTEQLKATGAEVTVSMLGELRIETDKAEGAARAARRMAWVAGAAAFVTVTALGGFLAAWL